MAAERPKCAELVTAIKGMTARDRDQYLQQFPWLDDLADTNTIAAWTGIAPTSITDYLTRKTAGPRRWPRPDESFGGRSTWRFRTILLFRASQPGKGTNRPPKRRRYSDEFKRRAVAVTSQPGRTPESVAAELGMNLHTLRAWITQSRKPSADSSTSTSDPSGTPASSS